MSDEQMKVGDQKLAGSSSVLARGTDEKRNRSKKYQIESKKWEPLYMNERFMERDSDNFVNKLLSRCAERQAVDKSDFCR
ncbi:hypothetical protein AVEN_187432-1, partial [Araneus ventricosus]